MNREVLKGLRASILVVMLGTVALALTVNYVMSAGFFLLAAIGMGIGLWRGFLRDFNRRERWLLVAFAALPLVALLTYAAGVETDIGFRMLGRLGRLLLFIPVFVAVRWAKPRRGGVGLALVVGVALALILGAFELAGGGGITMALAHYRAGIFPQGQAADHITFGDMALIQGFVGCVLLLGVGGSRRWRRLFPALGILGLFAGVATSVIAGARGGWLAIPVLGLWLIWHYRKRLRQRRAMVSIAVGAVAVLVAGVLFGRPLWQRATEGWQGAFSVVSAARSNKAQIRERLALCPNTPPVIGRIAAHSFSSPPGVLRVVSSGARWHKIGIIECLGAAALLIRAPASGTAEVVIPRNGEAFSRQGSALYAQGDFQWRLGQGRWHVVSRVTPGVVSIFQPGEGKTLRPLTIRLTPGNFARLVPLQLSPGSFVDYWANTSAGARLAMWSVAGRVFVDHPGHGVGYGSFRSLVRERIARGKAPASIGFYQHPHSDYLNVLYGSGLLGLLALLGLLGGVPWALRGFVRGAGDGDEPLRSTLFAGDLFAAGVAISAFTETLFIHSFTVSWFALVAVALMSTGAALVVPGDEEALPRHPVVSRYKPLLAIRRWWQYRDLLRNLVGKEIKVRYQGAFLGFAWSLMNPLLLSATYFVVFTIVFKSSMKNYALYMVGGIIHWNLFAVVVAQASDILVGNQSLLKKMAFPRILVPLSNLLVNLTLWLMGLLILLALMIPLGGHFSLAMLTYPVFLLLYLAFLFGIQLIVSILYVDFRDLKHLIEVLLMILFWTAPVVYPLTHLPAAIRPWLELSPFTEFIMIFESLIYGGHLPPWHLVAYFVVWTAAAFGLGSWLFLHRGRWIIERL